MLRPAINEGETLYRFASNDHVFFKFAPHYNAARSASPGVKAYDYVWTRFALSGTVPNDWIDYANSIPVSPEIGFIHHITNDVAGRRQDPTHSNAYVMNMGNATYRAWCCLKIVDLAKGNWYNTGPTYTYPPPCSGIQNDEALWYEQFDGTGNQNIKNSLEYVGNYTPYGQGCVTFQTEGQAALDAAFGVGNVILFPNFGDTSFLDHGASSYDNTNQDNLIAAASRMIMVENYVWYDNGEPNHSAETSATRWATLATNLTGGRKLVGRCRLVDNPPSQTETERWRVGGAAWLLMGWKPGMIVRFATALDGDASHISNWEQNSFWQTVTGYLGAPLGNYSSGGSGVEGILYQRAFAGGKAAIYIRKNGSVLNDNATVNLGGPMYRMKADGTFGALTSSANLALGEGAIFISSSTASSPLNYRSGKPTRNTSFSGGIRVPSRSIYKGRRR